MKGTESDLSIQPQLCQEKQIHRSCKLETSFLEKYFCHNLNDFFPRTFSNLYEDQLHQHTNSQEEKAISMKMFKVNKNSNIQAIERKIQTFYRQNSISIQNKELPFAFKFQYCNLEPMPNIVAQGELVYIGIKIKVQVSSIQSLAKRSLLSLENFQERKAKKITEFQKLLLNYKGNYFNLFIVYFGDCNFNYFNKDQYHQKYIKLMGKDFKLRIIVFYISKQAMIETFCLLNKVSIHDSINDLMIQFYELKRQRTRQKRKKLMLKNQKLKFNNHKKIISTMAGVLSLIIVKVIH